MNAEEWRRIERVVDQVLAVPGGERGFLLERLCGNDESLLLAVREFLRDCDVAATLYEGIPLTGAATLLPGVFPLVLPDAPLAPGTRLGPYQVVRLLGFGGMGSVYLADRADGQFEKRLALKVLRHGVRNAAAVERFKEERQLLARLEHPNIARLLDGGVTSEGVPYFVMEYVRGEPIDVWADRARLPIDARLRLFEQVCDAVAYAHRHLVIHRDIKPSNILVGANGQIKLVDFGIGRTLREGGEGAGGERGLTLPYASPEQVSGHATSTATDVYSLGVVLYELLSGRSPYGASALNPRVLEAAITLREVPPPSTVILEATGERTATSPPDWLAEARSTTPRQLVRRLEGDLDAIVLKALRKAPADRYASVDDLNEDLTRFRKHHPVRARPRRRGYVSARFVQRHRVAVGATALVVVAALVAMLSRLDALERAREMERARGSIQEFASLLLTTADPEASPMAMDDLERRFLERIRQASLPPRAMVGLMLLVADRTLQGEFWQVAAAFYARADSIAQSELGPADTLRIPALRGVAAVRRKQYRTWEAIPPLREAVEIAERRVDENPGVLAATLIDLGFSLTASANNAADPAAHSDSLGAARVAEARRHLGRALEIPLAGEEAAFALLRAHEGLGDAFFAEQDWSSAVEEYEQAIALHPRVPQAGGQDLGRFWLALGQIHNEWGLALRGDSALRADSAEISAQHLGEARAYLQQALDQLGRFSGTRNATVAEAHYSIGENARAQGSYEQAVRWYEQALDGFSSDTTNIQNAHTKAALGFTLLTDPATVGRARSLLCQAAAGYRKGGMDRWATGIDSLLQQGAIGC